jgi:hypothetical protein
MGRTIVTQSNRVSYNFPITKPGGARDTEANIWRAVRAVSPSDKSARHIMSAYAKWRDEDEDDDPPPRRNVTVDDFLAISGMQEVNNNVNRTTYFFPFIMELGNVTSQQERDARLQYWQQQGNTVDAAILQASVMIVATSPEGYRNSLGIGTIVGGNIVTHDHLGIGDAPFIEIVGAYGTIRMTGAEFNAMMASNATQALNGVRVLGAQAAGLDLGLIGQSTGVFASPYNPVQNRSNITPLQEEYSVGNAGYGPFSDSTVLRYVYNPDGDENDFCLDHSCLLVREIGAGIGGSQLGGVISNRRLVDGIDPLFVLNSDSPVDNIWFVDNFWRTAMQNQLETYSGIYPLQFDSDNDHPFSPGDSGAGFFMGANLMGVYQANVEGQPAIRGFALFPEQLEG